MRFTGSLAVSRQRPASVLFNVLELAPVVVMEGSSITIKKFLEKKKKFLGLTLDLTVGSDLVGLVQFCSGKRSNLD